MKTNKLYLFNNGWGYKIGEIRRINTKTVTMDTGDKIEIDKFDKEVQELTEMEEFFYKGELIKKLSNSTRQSLKKLLETLERTKIYLENCEFIELKTDKLQEVIDKTIDEISNESDLLIMNIQGKKVKLDERIYSREVEIVK